MGCNQIVSKSSEMDVLETFHLIAQHLNPWFCWAVFFSESQEKFEGQTYFFSDRNATVASFGETRARQKGVWLGPSIDTSHHNDSIDKDPADIAGVVVNEMPLLDAPPPPPPQINRHVGRWTTNFLYYTACVWVRGCVFFFCAVDVGDLLGFVSFYLVWLAFTGSDRYNRCSCSRLTSFFILDLFLNINHWSVQVWCTDSFDICNFLSSVFSVYTVETANKLSSSVRHIFTNSVGQHSLNDNWILKLFSHFFLPHGCLFR